MSPGLPENLSQWKNTVYSSSTPTPQRKIIFYLLITGLYQLLQPLHCSGLDCFPCCWWFLVLEKIYHRKEYKKNAFTYFQKTYMLRSVVSLDSWLHFKKGKENILRCQAQERLFCPTWSPGYTPHMIILSLLLLQIMELLGMEHASTGTKQMLISQTC